MALLVVASLVGIALPPGLADPGLSFKEGTFSKSTGAAPVSQNISGLGFSPKAVIFFWTRQTTSGLRTDAQVGYGFATGPANERAIALASDDLGVGPSNTGRRQSQAHSIILLDGGSPSLAAQAELLSLDANGFTINWTTNDGEADIVHYVALGGTDLTSALASSFTVTSGAGTQAVTGVGFRPDFVMTISLDSSTVSSNLADAKASLGWASGPTARGTISVTLVDAANPTDTCVRQRNDRFISELRSDCGDDMLADIVSFDSDGFTINKTNADDATLIHYLALKGGKYKVGAFNKSTGGAPASQSVTGVGFQPVGLLLTSMDLPANTSIVAEGRISLGASDGTSESATWFHDKDSSSNPIANQRTSTNKTGVHGSQSSLTAEADLTSFNADGFTLSWNPNNAVAEEILYVAFGNAVIITQSIVESWNQADVSSLLATKGMPEAWTTGAAANTNVTRALLDSWLSSDSVSRLVTKGVTEPWNTADATARVATEGVSELWTTADAAGTSVIRALLESWLSLDGVGRVATEALTEGWTMIDALGETIISLPTRVSKALVEEWRIRDSIGRTGMKEITESVRLAESPLLAAIVALGEAWRNSARAVEAALKSLGEGFGLTVGTVPAAVEQSAPGATMDGSVSQNLSYLPWLFGVGAGILLAALLRRRSRRR